MLAKQSTRIGEPVIHIGSSPALPNHLFAMTTSTVRSVGVENLAVPPSEMQPPIRCRVVTTATAFYDSGGPVIDRWGHLVAVSEGKAVGAAARNVTFSLDVTEVRAFLAEKKIAIKEPPASTDAMERQDKREPGPDLRPPITPDRGDLPKAEPRIRGMPTPEQELAADKALRVAQLFSQGDENRDTYVVRLKQVIAKYPGTAAAKAAQRALDGLK